MISLWCVCCVLSLDLHCFYASSIVKNFSLVVLYSFAIQYPELAQKLAPYLKLDLMLHQKHALCWM